MMATGGGTREVCVRGLRSPLAFLNSRQPAVSQDITPRHGQGGESPTLRAGRLIRGNFRLPHVTRISAQNGQLRCRGLKSPKDFTHIGS